MGYKPPLEDIDFTLNHVLDLAAVAKLNGFQHADPETVRGVLEEAGRFFSEVIAPLNTIGDKEGSRLQPDGTVRTPEGFRAAYAKFVEAGWGGVHVDERWGGGGLPYTVGVVVQARRLLSSMYRMSWPRCGLGMSAIAENMAMLPSHISRGFVRAFAELESSSTSGTARNPW